MQEEPANQQALHQLVLVLVSAAFLTVVVMASFLCGICNFFRRSKDDNGEEQKQPILGMEESKKLGPRSTSYSDKGKRPSLLASKKSEGILREVGKGKTKTELHKSWSFFGSQQATSGDSTLPLVPGQTTVQNVQPSIRRSQSTPMSALSSSQLTTVFEHSEGKMVAEPVQPDARKIGKQPSVMSAASAFSLAQEAFGLTESPEDEEEGEFVGKLQFSIKYEFTEETLVVKVLRATDLLAKDFSGTSDPFVKVMLLPNKKHKMETKVKRKKLNPVWNETFLFEGFPYNKLQERVLHLEVLDYDRFSRNDPIGELNIPLAEIDLTQEQTVNKTLTPSSKSYGKLGKILVSLCFAPTAGRITIVIMKCDGLAAKDITGKSDPYVKVWHVYQDKKIEKKKTIVKYNTLNPVFNVSFMFHVTLNKIRDTSFIISVVDKDRLSRNDTIGGIILGPKASPSETSHWAEMLNKPRTPVAQWHVLKDMG
ncbi:synaptotagmin-7-like isoform X2 [Acanthaster planci]|uniref:Synaptotagmin-7-like isoform X2 n=1 Tax=Acanthaster planci TaxID=133434 RepID=A0A8B8A2R8_ACAPL|nr:synaptotagmin-7-like isoform X2 [Acanthaster planci]